APVGDGPQTEGKYLVYSNITQLVDHFGGSTATWEQRYQYNHKFFNASTGIVFLMIGGEGSISPPGDKWVKDESITMMQWAQKYRAAAFQLEHRFYGPKENAPLRIYDEMRKQKWSKTLRELRYVVGYGKPALNWATSKLRITVPTESSEAQYQ
ncbi:hypothetical protein TELCIR_17582, partial [Teladorsagia circumcincta]